MPFPVFTDFCKGRNIASHALKIQKVPDGYPGLHKQILMSDDTPAGHINSKIPKKEARREQQADKNGSLCRPEWAFRHERLR